MSLLRELNTRAGSLCELCTSTDNLNSFLVQNAPNDGADGHALICQTCQTQIENADQAYPNHWRCLNDSMWSQVPAVQVLAWRMLYRLRAEGWTQDLLDMMYMDDETMAWAKSTEAMDGAVVHKDSNGNILEAGDTVTLIQDLKVKGASFVAKRGTAVRRISLVQDNPEHIEGKVDGQHIVILTKFVKKQK
jgi:protein PhnA